MKKLTLLLALCAFTFMVKAQYPQVLPIDYKSFFAPSAMGPDSLVKGTYVGTTAPIMANQWNGTTLGTPGYTESDLSYSNYSDNNLGKAIVLTNSKTQASYSLTKGNEYTGKPFFLGFLANFSTVNDFWIMSYEGKFAGYQRGKIHTKVSGLGYIVGLQFNQEPPIYGTTVLDFDRTYLFVLKSTPSLSDTQYMSLFINPTIGEGEPETPEVFNYMPQLELRQIQGIAFRQYATQNGKIAGLRFSDNWADVVNKLPTAPSILPATDINATGFTANWTTVENAKSYDVNVYLGAGLYSSTNVGGQATTSLAITGLPSGLIYTYKVMAKGNGVNYGASEESGAEIIKTTDENALNEVNEDFLDNSKWGTVQIPIEDTWSKNGYSIENGGFFMDTIRTTVPETYKNKISLSPIVNSNPGVVGTLDLPTINSLEKMEVTIASSSGADRSLFLKELVGNEWVTIHTFKGATQEAILTLNIDRSEPSKLRLENGSYSRISIMKISTVGKVSSTNNAKTEQSLMIMGNSIRSMEIGKFEVYNLQGILLLQESGVNQLNTNLNSGIYIARFTNRNGQIVTQKFIVKAN